MYAVEIKSRIAKVNDEQRQFMAFDGLLSSMRMNGQLLGREIFVVRRKRELVSQFVIPERDALDGSHNNKYVNMRLKELATVGLGAITVRALGDINDGAVCDCKVRKAYCIYSDYQYMNSPLRCMTCFGPVPLYSLPSSYGDEYSDIITWASDFESCHRLYMNDAVGERFAMNQMYKLDSALTRSGLDICARILKATGKKTYYFLRKHSGKSMEDERARKCPSCGGDWLLKKRLHPSCDFLCRKCQLGSNIAMGIY